MRNVRFVFVTSAVALLFAAGLWVSAHEGEEHPSSKGAVEVKGEVVDLSCYLDHNARGAKHRQCAQACAKKGLPMGILTADGKLYLLIEDHARADAYKQAISRAADIITVKGPVYQKGGIRAIKVQSVR